MFLLGTWCRLGADLVPTSVEHLYGGTAGMWFPLWFWWLWSSVVGQADGIPHLFPFRAEGVGFADNVKLSPPSLMILHLLASLTFLHLGIAHASMALLSTCETVVEK